MTPSESEFARSFAWHLEARFARRRPVASPALTPEQEARNMLDRIGVAHARDFSSGDLVELANLIHDARKVGLLPQPETP